MRLVPRTIPKLKTFISTLFSTIIGYAICCGLGVVEFTDAGCLVLPVIAYFGALALDQFLDPQL